MAALTAETIEFKTYRQYIRYLENYEDRNYDFWLEINHKDYIAYYIQHEGKDIQDITKDILNIVLLFSIDNEMFEDFRDLINACIRNGAKLKPFTNTMFAKPEEINIEYYLTVRDLEQAIEARCSIINFYRKHLDIDYILKYTNWDEVEEFKRSSDMNNNNYSSNNNDEMKKITDYNRDEINKMIMQMYKKHLNFKNLKKEQEIRRIATKKRAMLSRNALAAQMIVTGRGPKAQEAVPAGGAGAAAPVHAGPAGGAGAAAPANVSVLEGLPQETRNLIASFISGAERNHLNPIKAKIAKETAKLPRRRKHRTRRRNL